MRARLDWRADGGFAGGIEVLPFGVLIFVVGSLLVANAWAVIDAKMAVTAAAREAARTYVEADDAIDGRSSAEAAARAALDGHGRDPGRSTVAIAHEGDAPFARCVRVTVEVHHPVPAIVLPSVGGYGDGFDVTATHTELIDPFRDGLEAGGRC
jgi:hypothetical protein